MVVLVLVLVSTACTGSGSKSGPGSAAGATTVVTVPLTEPTTAPAPTTTTTTIAGHPRTVTTLSPALGPGQARLAGTVSGPDGPVAGATVRVERLVGDSVAATTVQTGAGGQWGVDSVNGGRYRLRAWKAPDLAALLPTLVFVIATETKTVNLAVDRYGNASPVATVSPNPPVANQPATLVVTVSDGGVDADGVLHAQPRPGIPVQLSVGAGLALSSADATVTDASGNAGFQVACTQAGPISATVVVASVHHPLQLPACAAR